MRVYPIMIAILLLVSGCHSTSTSTTTTTTPALTSNLPKNLDPEMMLATIPNATEHFTEWKTHSGVQLWTSADETIVEVPYSFAAKKYIWNNEDQIVEIVITDSLGLDESNSFCYKMVSLNLTTGYQIPIGFKDYYSWEILDYGESLDGGHRGRLIIGLGNRVVVSINGVQGVPLEDLYELANAVDYKRLEALMDTKVVDGPA